MNCALDHAIPSVLSLSFRDTSWMSTAMIAMQLKERGYELRYLRKLWPRLEALHGNWRMTAIQKDGKREILLQRKTRLAEVLPAVVEKSGGKRASRRAGVLVTLGR